MTATKQAPQEGVQITPQQVQAACQQAVQWITEGRLNLPSDAAMNGSLGVLNATLTAIATGQSVLIAPAAIEQLMANQKPAKKKPAAKKKVAKKVSKKAPSKKR